jgi:uncharacterized protein (UPF0548 family)
MITLGRPSVAQLDAVLERAATADISYDHRGSTLAAGPGRYERTIDLGGDPDTFDRAVAGLRAWACHGGIGATIHPSRVPIAEGTNLIVVLRVGPLRLLVPDRVVAIVDEPDRFGFAYGTLPGHPERGEEAFIVERTSGGRVTATIRVEARGAWLAARLGAPVVTVFQRLALRRYLGGWQRFVNERGTP